MPKVSVIIPVHNTEKYLITCLNSVLNQTEESIEVIAINDHSVDSSMKILKRFESKYKHKLKVIDLVDKSGVSSARNTGLEVAQGDFIGFVDSDDAISLNMYKDLYHMANTFNIDIATTNFFRFKLDIMDKNKETFTKEHLNDYEISNFTKNHKDFFMQTPAVWDKLFKHELLENITFLDNHIYEDVGFSYLSLLLSEHAITYSKNDFNKNPDYGYRLTPGGIMSKITTIKPDIVDIIDVAEHSYNLANQLKFDENKLKLLRDVLKTNIIKRTTSIYKWDLEAEEMVDIMSKMLSIANTTFSGIFFAETDFWNYYMSALTASLLCLPIKTIEKENLESEKTNLRNKIKVLSNTKQ